MVEDGTSNNLPPMAIDWAKIDDIDTCMYEDKKCPLFLDYPEGEYLTQEEFL